MSFLNSKSNQTCSDLVVKVSNSKCLFVKVVVCLISYTKRGSKHRTDFEWESDLVATFSLFSFTLRPFSEFLLLKKNHIFSTTYSTERVFSYHLDECVEVTCANSSGGCVWFVSLRGVECRCANCARPPLSFNTFYINVGVNLRL